MGFSVDGISDALGFFYYILVYGIGILAMVFSVSAYQFKRRVTIILFNFCGQLCWIMYFLLQGDLTSAIVCGLTALMLAVFSLLSFKVWSDIFPLTAGIFAVIANSRSTEKRLRQFSVLWLLSWLMNSTFKMYPVAFINDFMCTVSAIVSLIRYREKRIKNT